VIIVQLHNFPQKFFSIIVQIEKKWYNHKRILETGVEKLPLAIDVKPYLLNKVLGGDSYLTHYAGSGADGEEFVITEFYPTYMVIRNEEDKSTLDVSDRFNKEFAADRDKFVARCEGLSAIKDSSLHPVVEIFERNRTAYMVRKACVMTGIDQYMGGMTMDFDEAFFFMRPLLVSMALAAEKGMIFNISPDDFKVSSFKSLVLCAPPAWDNNFHPTIVKLMQLYYKLVTGTDAPDSGAPAISAYGVEIPNRIEAMVMEVLGGDILYGSLDDFYKKFKTLIDGTQENSQETSKKTLTFMRGAAAVLFVMFAFSLTLLGFGAVNAHRTGTFWANPDLFASDEIPPPPDYDFSAITLTHPRNTADALSGSFAAYDGFLFFRGDGGMKSRLFADIIFIPGATGQLALAEDRLIVPGASPSFIVGHRRTVYFVDSAAGGLVYSVSTTGNDITRVTDYPVLNLAVVGDYLFYTNVDSGHHLYRINLVTNLHERLFEHPVYATLADGSHLFFVVNYGQGTGNTLYAWDIDAGTRIQLATNAAGKMRTFNDLLFFLTTDGRVHSMTFDGRHISTLTAENVRTFDVFFNWLIFAEEGRHIPRAYNMNNGNTYTLSTTDWVSYIWVYDQQIYAIDHRNPNRVHNFGMRW
jgi:hypothetical protein